MIITFFKGEQLVEQFRESALPGKYCDILGFSYSGETCIWTVNFMSEGIDKPQVYQAQMGNDTDRVYVETETEYVETRP